jgi:hypothetical protein
MQARCRATGEEKARISPAREKIYRKGCRVAMSVPDYILAGRT